MPEASQMIGIWHKESCTMRGLLLTVLALLSLSLQAQDKTPALITIVSPQIPWLLDPENPGPYNDLMDELFVGFDQPLQVSILPVRRAQREFFDGPALCFYAGNYDDVYFETTGIARDSLIISRPFNVSYIRAFTPARLDTVENIAQAAGQNAAVDLSIGAVQLILDALPKSVEPIMASNTLHAHALVSQGRAKTAIMVDYDYRLFVARHPSKAPLHFHVGLDFGTVEDAVMCKRSDQAASLIEHINSKTRSLNADGMLAKILAPDYERSRRQFAEQPHPYLVTYQPATP
ncbi:MAG: hypothetical protein JJ850_10375 [Kordiimonadaceae bacterium]|nr:hypothetical protein [Kordiimonadaceae bacterium]MBO6569540.1 hypothetical protein [Kordiimonadaceae bacterium]MBO6965015.1 hypothetical protein [Kordiimonadaceae bacterium]